MGGPRLMPRGYHQIHRVPARPALCHPMRREVRDGQCRLCLQLASDLGVGPRGVPPRVEGAWGARSPGLPLNCPKCHAQPPMWRVSPAPTPTYGSCLACGADWYVISLRLVRGVPGTPQPPSTPKGADTWK